MPAPQAMKCPEDPKEQMRTMWFSKGPGRGKTGVKRNYWSYYCPKHKVLVVYGVKFY